jgi:alpha-tubulin suppressor-like RCC1 family protein
LKNNHDIINFITMPIENQFFSNAKLNVIELSLGYMHSLALAENENGKKSLYGWGSSKNNECGNGKIPITYLPKKIEFFEDYEIEVFRAGKMASMVKTDKGLFVFGHDKFMAEIKHSNDTNNYRCLQYSRVSNIKDFELAAKTTIFLVDI